MFKEYESKPIKRLAHLVVESDVITKIDESTSILQPLDFTETVTFKHYDPVKVGDYIVCVDDTDIYHCNAKVFAERNIV